jgi:hypothetical protein
MHLRFSPTKDSTLPILIDLAVEKYEQISYFPFFQFIFSPTNEDPLQVKFSVISSEGIAGTQ